MNQRTVQIISGVLILCVGIGIGFAIGYSKLKPIYQKGYLEGKLAGSREVEQKYQKKIAEVFPPLPEPEEVFSVSGTIDEIKDKTIVLKVVYPSSNPFEKPKTEIKNVQVADTTKIVKRVEEAVPQPKPFKEAPLSFSELKKGDSIIAEAGENIKGKSAFSATKITLQ